MKGVGGEWFEWEVILSRYEHVHVVRRTVCKARLARPCVVYSAVFEDATYRRLEYGVPRGAVWRDFLKHPIECSRSCVRDICCCLIKWMLALRECASLATITAHTTHLRRYCWKYSILSVSRPSSERHQHMVFSSRALLPPPHVPPRASCAGDFLTPERRSNGQSSNSTSTGHDYVVCGPARPRRLPHPRTPQPLTLLHILVPFSSVLDGPIGLLASTRDLWLDKIPGGARGRSGHVPGAGEVEGAAVPWKQPGGWTFAFSSLLYFFVFFRSCFLFFLSFSAGRFGVNAKFFESSCVMYYPLGVAGSREKRDQQESRLGANV